MSRSDLPPVPPAARPRSGEARSAASDRRDDALAKGADPTARNLASQGRQGNVAQNTTNKGLQQDR